MSEPNATPWQRTQESYVTASQLTVTDPPSQNIVNTPSNTAKTPSVLDLFDSDSSTSSPQPTNKSENRSETDDLKQTSLKSKTPTEQVKPRALQTTSKAVSPSPKRKQSKKDNNGKGYHSFNPKKCSYRSCLFRHAAVEKVMYLCYVDGCDKKYHFGCYEQAILSQYSLKHFVPDDDDDREMYVACTRSHYDIAVKKAASAFSKTGKNIPWNHDGPGGPDDPNNSESILVLWLKDPYNFARYKGDGNGGKSRQDVCNEISKLIASKKCVRERTWKAVHNKIETIIGTFKNASAKLMGTGFGTMNGLTIDEEVHNFFFCILTIVSCSLLMDFFSPFSVANYLSILQRPKRSTDGKGWDQAPSHF